MKDIKEVRQALEKLDSLTRTENSNVACGYLKCGEISILDQFIADVEKLIKENEELKKKYHCSICQFKDIEQYCDNCSYIKESENK